MPHPVFLAALLSLGPHVAAKDDAPAPKQFVDRSVVTFPRHVGDYTLAETHYDPQHWGHGVTSKWVINAAPAGLRYTLFVYPLGHTTEQQAVALQMEDVERSLQQAVEQGIYSDLVAGAREPFVVVARASSMAKPGDDAGPERGDGDEEPAKPFDPVPRPEVEVKASRDSDPLAAAFAASMPSPNNHGQRQSFRFVHEGVPVRSLGYVFYRHLFAFKVRVTAPLDSMDDATFVALADTATRYLVPQVEVQNFGQCGNINVSPPSTSRRKKKQDSERFARELILGIARVKAANCAAAAGEAEPAAEPGQTRIEIVYPPKAWKADD